MALEESYLTSSIPKRIIVSDCHFLKEIDQFLWRTTGEVTTNTYLKSCGYLSAALSFMGIFSNSKYSDHTMLYFYVMCNMLEPVDLHETIPTSILCQ